MKEVRYKIVCVKDFHIYSSEIIPDNKYQWISNKIYEMSEYLNHGIGIDDCYAVVCEEDSGFTNVKNNKFIFYVNSGVKEYYNEFMENFITLHEYRNLKIEKFLE